MDTSEYMPMFLAEAQEHLQVLNLAVVRLEESPEDRSTVDEIFRIAHSLKGMSATMGFTAVAALTHEMEDVFELLRQRQEPLSRDAVDTLLICLDALAGAVDSIESTGTENLDHEPLVTRLRSLVRARNNEQAAALNGGRYEPDLRQAAELGIRVLHVTVTLDPEVMMPAVRAHMVLAALTDHGEPIGSAPTPDGVELFDGRVIEAWLASEEEGSVILASINGVSDVSSAEVVEVLTSAGEAPRPGPSENAPAAPPSPAGTSDTPPASQSASEAPHPAVISAVPPSPVPPSPPAAGGSAPTPVKNNSRTVRVDAERLDALMHSMGELVIQRTAVEAMAAELDAPELHHAVQELTRTSQALQSMVMQVRMIPVEVVFLRFPRLVRDLSAKLGKQVKLELIGSDTELDRTVVDALGDPLVHLLRNALDHGLERTEDRIAADKDPVGKLQIVARHAGGSVVIEVRDDGHGIDAASVARKAASVGLIDPSAVDTIDLKGAIELLFAPGFSTVETMSDISGRGVGMDAVRTKIRELGGEVTIESSLGAGTTAQIRLPLTLAIVSGLLVRIGDGTYAIPLDRIDRTLLLGEQNVQSVAGERMLVLDEGVLPLLDGAAVFGRPAARHEFAVIVRTLDQRIAIEVDELIGQRELVTRPLPPVVSEAEPVSGGTALPNGRIALIVDCDALPARARARPDGPHPINRTAAASMAVSAI